MQADACLNVIASLTACVFWLSRCICQRPFCSYGPFFGRGTFRLICANQEQRSNVTSLDFQPFQGFPSFIAHCVAGIVGCCMRQYLFCSNIGCEVSSGDSQYAGRSWFQSSHFERIQIVAMVNSEIWDFQGCSNERKIVLKHTIHALFIFKAS